MYIDSLRKIFPAGFFKQHATLKKISVFLIRIFMFPTLLIRKYQYKNSQPHPFKTKNGIVYFILKFDSRAKIRVKEGFLPDCSMKIFYEEAYKAELIIDIGANYGEFIFPLLVDRKKDSIDQNIIAFEANKKLCECLYKTREKNSISSKQLEIVNIGLGSSNAQMIFYINIQSAGFSSLCKQEFFERQGNLAIKQKVSVTTLDNFFKDQGIDLSQRICIKIDVEGFDFHVLYGAKMILKKAKSIFIMLEAGLNSFNQAYDLWEEFMEWLWDEYNLGFINPITEKVSMINKKPIKKSIERLFRGVDGLNLIMAKNYPGYEN